MHFDYTPRGVCSRAIHIDLSDDEDLYNTTRLPLEETPAYTFTLVPRPGRSKTTYVRLPDAWGEELLERLVAQDEVFDSQDDFKNEFTHFTSEKQGFPPLVSLKFPHKQIHSTEGNSCPLKKNWPRFITNFIALSANAMSAPLHITRRDIPF